MDEMKIEDDAEFERQVKLQGGTVEALKKRFEEGLLLQEVRRMEVDSKVTVSGAGDRRTLSAEHSGLHPAAADASA